MYLWSVAQCSLQSNLVTNRRTLDTKPERNSLEGFEIAQDIEGDQALGERGRPLAGTKQRCFMARISHSCAHLLKQLILRKENLFGLDLVTCPPVWEGGIIGVLWRKLPTQAAILLPKGKVTRWWKGNKEQVFVTHLPCGVAQCILALNVLCRERTYTTICELAIFHIYCFLCNVCYPQEWLVLLQMPFIFDWIPPMIYIIVSQSFNRFISRISQILKY